MTRLPFARSLLCLPRVVALGLGLAAALPHTIAAQIASPPDGPGDTSLFAPLALPPSTPYRLADGRPGPAYWQNRADYDIRATLDTTRKTMRGELTPRYTNHAPVALDHVWLQLEQNAFRATSLSAILVGPGARFGAAGFQGGIELDRVAQRLPGGLLHGGHRVPLTASGTGTMLRLALAKSLRPGQTATLEIASHFRVPEHGADRMGRQGSLYEIAQWYPRVAVYDDVAGWNTEPYVGQGEFYLEYGDFTYA